MTSSSPGISEIGASEVAKGLFALIGIGFGIEEKFLIENFEIGLIL